MEHAKYIVYTLDNRYMHYALCTYDNVSCTICCVQYIGYLIMYTCMLMECRYIVVRLQGVQSVYYG
jgi:hypothetical protein